MNLTAGVGDTTVECYSEDSCRGLILNAANSRNTYLNCKTGTNNCLGAQVTCFNNLINPYQIDVKNSSCRVDCYMENQGCENLNMIIRCCLIFFLCVSFFLQAYVLLCTSKKKILKKIKK